MLMNIAAGICCVLVFGSVAAFWIHSSRTSGETDDKNEKNKK